MTGGMNVKRKLTALLLLLALLLSLTACGDAVQTIDTIQQAAQKKVDFFS